MSDPISALLAVMAREVAHDIFSAGWKDVRTADEIILAVLRKRLGPLLEAGQACADAVEMECGDSGPESCDKRWRAAWEAALTGPC